MPFDLDVIIIGAGFAGLSAANTLARQIHTVGVFDSGSYHNDGTPHMHAVPTWDHKHPTEFRTATRENILANYKTVQFFQHGVKSIKAIENKTDSGTAFEAIDDKGKAWTCRKVLLASGVVDVFPDIPGYAECWVKGIFHCLVCHGYEERDSGRSGVLAVGDFSSVAAALHLGRMSLQITPEKVTLYTNGANELASQLEAGLAGAKNLTVDERKIKRLEKGPKAAEVIVHFEDGSSVTEGYLAHKPSCRLRGDLWKQLGVETTPDGLMKVSAPWNQTSVRGVFSSGDAASPMMTATQALFSGSITSAGVLSQLQADLYGQKSMV